MVLHDVREHADRHHGHIHAPRSFGFAFAVGTAFNVALVAAQVVYGIQAGSIALITDAGHNLGDALGLLLAWGAYALARWEPTERCRGHGHAISTPAR